MKTKLVSLCLTFALLVGLCLPAGAVQVQTGVMTPYAQAQTPEEFYSGATFMLERTDDTEGWLTRELEKMSSQYHINTITVYGLENFDEAGSTRYKDHLFKELARLGMKIVVRIESYDGRTFAFTAEDARSVVSSHRSLIDYVSSEQNRGQVAYFALNMPVDDGAVQANLGGVNSAKSKQNQAAYAEEIVRLMRAAAAENGFNDAKMFLSLFYGWDNTYEIPSYAAAEADGYFINNYSYPAGRIPTAEDDDKTLINADRLRISMDTFVRQYGDKPIVVECGFHTLEYNNGERPNQTAGLVQDVAAKRKAMLAMVDFYKNNYPQVRGILYFGYNLYKEEGNPPSVLDWSLEYPSREVAQAEQAGFLGQVTLTQNPEAAEGMAVAMEGQGSGVSFSKCLPAQQLALRYQTEQPVSVGFYVGGKLKKTVELPASSAYSEFGVLVSVVEGYDLEIKLEGEGALQLDQVRFLETMEAEYAQLAGSAQVKQHESASNGAYVTGLTGAENAVSYSGSRGGETIALAYRCAAPTKLVLAVNGETFSLELPAAKSFTTLKVNMELASGADFSLYAETEGFELDGVQLAGTPLPVAKTEGASGSEPVPGQSDATPAGGLPVLPIAIALGAVVLIAGAVLLLRRKKGE